MKYTAVPTLGVGSSRIDSCEATFAELVALLGEPTRQLHEKSDAEFAARGDNGDEVVAWDYKSDVPAEKNTRWSLWYGSPAAGARFKKALEELRSEPDPLEELSDQDVKLMRELCCLHAAIPALEANHFHPVPTLVPCEAVLRLGYVRNVWSQDGDLIQLTQAGWAVCAEQCWSDEPFAQLMVEHLEDLRSV